VQWNFNSAREEMIERMKQMKKGEREGERKKVEF
jgi:hypothetical protein